MRIATSRCVVVVPIYRWPSPKEEMVALEQILTHLDQFDMLALAPEGLALGGLPLPVRRFSASAFESRDAYSKLLLTPSFYSAFSSWEWMLVAQLDSLVLAATLNPWLDASFDYVGAPWLRFPGRPECGFSRVGNGGLSLRRIHRFAEVLSGRPRAASFRAVFSGTAAPDLQDVPLPQRLLRAARTWQSARVGSRRYTEAYTLNEDHFWSDRARLFDPSFSVPSFDAALAFAFEEAPRLAYEMAGHRLPFGVHAWNRYDPEFWHEQLPWLEGAVALGGTCQPAGRTQRGPKAIA